MITLWACPTFIILVFRFSSLNYLESLLDLVEHTGILNPLGSTTLVIIFVIFFPSSILVNSLLTSPGYCDQDPLIPVFLIHNFRNCVTGIFSIVTGDDFIRDSRLLDSAISFIFSSKEDKSHERIFNDKTKCFSK